MNGAADNGKTRAPAAPACSVIIPTFNRARCLRRSVESVLRQTFTDIELIVVDDASTDDTQALLGSFRDQRLRIVSHPVNRGGAAARNTGIGAARAPVVAFQDSDDEWLVTKLERQMALFREGYANGTRVVYCGKAVYGRDDTGSGSRKIAYVPRADIPVTSGNVLRQILQTPLVSTQTLVVCKDTILRVGGFDERLKLAQDWELSIRLARETEFAFIDEPLVMTYIMGDSISQSRSNTAHAREIIIERNMDLLVKSRPLLSHNYVDIGRAYQRDGQWKHGAPFVRKALSANLGNHRAWLALLLGLRHGAV